VPDFGKPPQWPAADLMAWGIGLIELGVRGFQCLKLAHQAVVLGIGDDKFIAFVVGTRGGSQLLAQCADPTAGDGIWGHAPFYRGAHTLARSRMQPAIFPYNLLA